MPKKVVTGDKLPAEAIETVETAGANLLSFDQYVQATGASIHPYSVAYLRPVLFGTLKLKSDWDATMVAMGVK